MGCAAPWTLHPAATMRRERVFSPDPAEVAFAKKIIEAMPDGTGAVMIDGEIADDATWKQAKVVVDLHRLVAAKDAGGGGAACSLWRRAGVCRDPDYVVSVGKMRNAKFKIGQVVVSSPPVSVFAVVFDIDPEFNNTEEWSSRSRRRLRPHGSAVLSPVRGECGE